MRDKNDFYIFVPNDLDLWPLGLEFASLFTPVQRYVSTKLEVSTAFLFRENRRHGRTDRQTDDGRTDVMQCLMRPRGPHNNIVTIELSKANKWNERSLDVLSAIESCSVWIGYVSVTQQYFVQTNTIRYDTIAEFNVD